MPDNASTTARPQNGTNAARVAALVRSDEAAVAQPLRGVEELARSARRSPRRDSIIRPSGSSRRRRSRTRRRSAPAGTLERRDDDALERRLDRRRHPSRAEAGTLRVAPAPPGAVSSTAPGAGGNRPSWCSETSARSDRHRRPTGCRCRGARPSRRRQSARAHAAWRARSTATATLREQAEAHPVSPARDARAAGRARTHCRPAVEHRLDRRDRATCGERRDLVRAGAERGASRPRRRLRSVRQRRIRSTYSAV